MLVQDGVSLLFVGTPGVLDPVVRQFNASEFMPSQVLPCSVGFEISGTSLPTARPSRETLRRYSSTSSLLPAA
jgi:hypothetical protein